MSVIVIDKYNYNLLYLLIRLQRRGWQTANWAKQYDAALNDSAAK